MPNITLNKFGPKLPILSPYNLPPQLGTTAQNIDIRSGAIVSIKAPTESQDLGSDVVPKTLWKMGSTIIYFPDGELNDVVDSQINESNNMIFWTDGVMPKYSNDDLWGEDTWYYRLGVPAPTTEITIGSHFGTADPDVQEYVSYVYTYLATTPDGAVWESAPSSATAVETIYIGEGVALSTIADPPTDDNVNYTGKRLYRLSSGTQGAEFQFLAELAVDTTTYNDWDAGNTQLNQVSTDVIDTEGWEAPPDTLEGLTQAHNGMLIGYVGKTLYISEPYIPYAFPSTYTIDFDDDIIGVGCFNEYIIVFTNTSIYTVTGSDPDNLLPAKLPFNQACLSHRGIRTVANGVFFPSPDGLCFCDGSFIQVLTEGIISKEDWLALSPSTLISMIYDTRYYGFFSGTGTGIKIDTKLGGIVDLSLSTYTNKIYDVYQDSSTDTLYMLSTNTAGDNGYIHTYGSSSTNLTYIWRSKYFLDKADYTCIKVTADCTSNKTVTISFYVEDADHNGTPQTIVINSANVNTMIRLQAFPYHNIKSIKLTGDAPVYAIQIATSPRELM